jgi:Cu(I)/Ag(I) efflux system membrane fusion protein
LSGFEFRRHSPRLRAWGAPSVALALLAACAACSDQDGPSDAPAHQHHHPSTDSVAGGGGNGEVQLSSDTIRRIGLRTVAAELSPLPGTLSAPGVVRYDERSIRNVYVSTEGWIRQLSVRAAGEPVAAGQLLFELQSPQLLTVDRSYLHAAEGGSSGDDNPYVRGLRSLGLTDETIAALKDKKRAPGRVPFRAPIAGVLTELHFRDDALVPQGANIMQLAALDPIWVIAEVPEFRAGSISIGSTAEVLAPAYPGRTFRGKVDYLYSELNPGNRTLRVRVVLKNTDQALKPNMYVTTQLQEGTAAPVVHVPRDAVIRGGETDRVVLALGDGRFTARQVRTGAESGDQVAILEGLAAGEQVVTAAVFLVDSEASLRASLSRLDSAPAMGSPHEHHMHGAM